MISPTGRAARLHPPRWDAWDACERDLARVADRFLELADAGRLPRLRAELLCHAVAALHEAAREVLSEAPVRLLLAALLLFAAPAGAQVCLPPESTLQVGTNPSDNRHHSSAIMFVNAFKGASPWKSPSHASPCEGMVCDSDGYVVSFTSATVAESYLFREIAPSTPGTGGPACDSAAQCAAIPVAGTPACTPGILCAPSPYPWYEGGLYQFTWSGDGAWSFDFDATTNCPECSIDNVNKVAIVKVTPSSGGVRLRITDPDLNDDGVYFKPLTFKLLVNGEPECGTFKPQYLADLASLPGPIRVMNLVNSNNEAGGSWAYNLVEDWDDRVPVTSYTQAWGYPHGGVSPEYLIQLANETGRDLWYNFPVGVTEDYVMGFGALADATLQTRLWPEYVNEAWNSGAAYSIIHAWLTAAGQAAELGTPYLSRWYGFQSARIFDWLYTAYGSDAADRIVRVIAWQNANPNSVLDVLDYRLSGDGACSSSTTTCVYEKADVVAVAPYFSGYNFCGTDAANDIALFKGHTLEQRFARALADIPAQMAFVSQYRALASVRINDRGKPLVLAAYEGGQHWTPACGGENDAALGIAVGETQRAPGMFDVYQEYLRAWATASGCGTFAHFMGTARDVKWGYYGDRQFQNQTANRPKYDALRSGIVCP